MIFSIASGVYGIEPYSMVGWVVIASWITPEDRFWHRYNLLYKEQQLAILS